MGGQAGEELLVGGAVVEQFGGDQDVVGFEVAGITGEAGAQVGFPVVITLGRSIRLWVMTVGKTVMVSAVGFVLGEASVVVLAWRSIPTVQVVTSRPRTVREVFAL